MNEEQKPAKKNTILIVVILLIVVIAAVIAWTMMGKKEVTPETEKPVTVPTEETEGEENQKVQTGVEMDFENTNAVEPLDGKPSEAYDLMMPKLKEVFPEGVKLKSTSESYSTYIVNRILTADDITALRKELENDKFTIESMDEKSISVKKGQTAVFSIYFYDIDSSDRAEISIFNNY